MVVAVTIFQGFCSVGDYSSILLRSFYEYSRTWIN